MARTVNHTVTITTASNGAGVGYTPDVDGYVDRVIYTKTDYADGVDFTVSTEDTSETIWAENNVNATKVVHPRTTLDRAADGTEITTQFQPVRCAKERVKIVVLNGGEETTGTFNVLVVEYG